MSSFSSKNNLSNAKHEKNYYTKLNSITMQKNPISINKRLFSKHPKAMHDIGFTVSLTVLA